MVDLVDLGSIDDEIEKLKLKDAQVEKLSKGELEKHVKKYFKLNSTVEKFIEQIEKGLEENVDQADVEKRSEDIGVELRRLQKIIKRKGAEAPERAAKNKKKKTKQRTKKAEQRKDEAAESPYCGRGESLLAFMRQAMGVDEGYREEWKEIQVPKENGGLAIWKGKKEGSKIFAAKATVTINAPLEKAVDYITTVSTYGEHQLEIDPMQVYCNELESWGPDKLEVGQRHEAWWTAMVVLGSGLSPRLAEYYEMDLWESDDRCWALFTNIDDQERALKPAKGSTIPPAYSNAIPVIMSWGCYMMERAKGGKTRLTLALHGDPGGWLPAWLLNLTIKEQAKTLVTVGKILSGQGATKKEAPKQPTKADKKK